MHDEEVEIEGGDAFEGEGGEDWNYNIEDLSGMLRHLLGAVQGQPQQQQQQQQQQEEPAPHAGAPLFFNLVNPLLNPPFPPDGPSPGGPASPLNFGL